MLAPIFYFMSAEKIQKPARIHSPHPFLRADKMQNRVRIEAPPHCPNTWRAEPQKEKCPFHFRKNHPREK